MAEEEEKMRIQNDLRILTERLSRVNDSLSRKVASRNEYDKSIVETEAAYMKVWVIDFFDSGGYVYICWCRFWRAARLCCTC